MDVYCLDCGIIEPPPSRVKALDRKEVVGFAKDDWKAGHRWNRRQIEKYFAGCYSTCKMGRYRRGFRTKDELSKLSSRGAVLWTSPKRRILEKNVEQNRKRIVRREARKS